MALAKPNKFDELGISTILPYILPAVRLFKKVNAYVKEFYGIMDVVGDGYCGYYMLGLLTYLRTGQIMDTQQVIDDVRSVYTMIIPGYNNIKPNTNHWLDVSELSMYAYKHNMNVCVFKENEKGTEYVIGQTFIYNADGYWAFVKLASNSHYQLLCARSSDGKEFRGLFSIRNAQDLVNHSDKTPELLFISEDRKTVQLNAIRTFLEDDYTKLITIHAKPKQHIVKEERKGEERKGEERKGEERKGKEEKAKGKLKEKPKEKPKKEHEEKPNEENPKGKKLKVEKKKSQSPVFNGDEEEFSNLLIKARLIVLKLARS